VFFSVSLAEEFSRSICLHSYIEVRSTLTQGYKHSPHMFNQVLGQDLEGIVTLCSRSFAVLTNPGGLPSGFH